MKELANMIVIRILLWLIIIGVLGSPVVASFALEKQPLIDRQPDPGAQAIRAAQDFIARYDPRTMPRDRPTEIDATPAQINAALASALAPLPGVRARVVPAPQGLVTGITLRLPVPDNPFGTYLNMRMVLESTEQGVHIEQMSIGDIDVPQPLVRPIFTLVMDEVAGPGQGNAFLKRVGAIRTDGGNVKVIFSPDGAMADQLKDAARRAAESHGLPRR